MSARSLARDNAEPFDGRRRTVIEGVTPQVDGGRFAIKRAVGEIVTVEADVFTDGHDAVRSRLRHKQKEDTEWTEVEMEFIGNDRWRASFVVDRVGEYEYSITAWTDRFLTWRRDLERRIDPADVLVALQVGAQLLKEAAARATGTDAKRLTEAAAEIAKAESAQAGRERALDMELVLLASRYPDRRFATDSDCVWRVTVDRELARCGAWYEFFPRSFAARPHTHGTFADAQTMLPYVAAMGFDIVYLPPIHPIGAVNRKGKNNALIAKADDVGSPWAIGGAGGGHKVVHRELGTLNDFRAFMDAAHEHDLEVAIDIAFQCSPDHPYLKEHPEWFRVRPDGTMQYAENPPKKYQDIYPFDFETEAWRELHRELIDVVLFWARHGVKIFRVDNPHTKPYSLWERLIAETKSQYPETIFLAEAFTRPRVMHRLAKLGFTQSYTYFAWRNTKHELIEYFTELTASASREYFRPNVWPNTPDILTEFLQVGGRAAFAIRFVLAATLSATYGIYGPAFELLESEPREPGSEEYLHSEKFQLRHWDIDRADSLQAFIARVNGIRREHPALQSDWSLRFIDVDNDNLIAYAKTSADGRDSIVTIVNLDPFHAHQGWLELPLDALGLDAARPYRMQDLLSGASYLWQGARNFVHLDPKGVVAHIFRVRRHVRTERDFDYFL